MDAAQISHIISQRSRKIACNFDRSDIVLICVFAATTFNVHDTINEANESLVTNAVGLEILAFSSVYSKIDFLIEIAGNDKVGWLLPWRYVLSVHAGLDTLFIRCDS